MLNVAILGFEGASILDIAGPLQVFASASQLGRRKYRVVLISMSGMGIRTSSEVLLSTLPAQQELAAGIDTLLVAGGPGALSAAHDKTITQWLQSNRKAFRRIGSICTGAFILAAAGILDKRRAATHWAHAEDLQREFPSVCVERDALFINDKEIWTSGGVTAGIDMALELVQIDAGRELAVKTAKELVLAQMRSGGQSQFSAHLAIQSVPDDLRGLLEHILEFPQEDYDFAGTLSPIGNKYVIALPCLQSTGQNDPTTICGGGAGGTG